MGVRRWAVLTIGGLVLAEIATRFVIGTPPLYVADPKLEYLFAPNQSGVRLGKHFSYNTFSMRSPEFAAHRQPGEFRLMVFGDSIINGGSLTDQADIATSLIAKRTGWIVGNISAGGWGPPNELAYAKRYGFFDADVIALVLSSHDYADAPTFEPLDEVEQITAKPPSVLWYAMRRYIPRLIPQPVVPVNVTQRQVEIAMGAIRDFVRLAQQHGRLIVFLHSTSAELQGHPEAGHAEIRALLASLDVRVVELAPYERPAFYVDGLHMDEAGHDALAEAIIDAVR